MYQNQDHNCGWGDSSAESVLTLLLLIEILYINNIYKEHFNYKNNLNNSLYFFFISVYFCVLTYLF